MKTIALSSLLLLSPLPAFADVLPGDHLVAGDGQVSVSGERGILNVRICGEAAHVLFDNLTDARETSRHLGSLLLTTRESRELLCTFSAEVASTYECAFHVDSSGVALADSVAFTEDFRPGDVAVSAQGTVRASGMRGVLNVQFSGQPAELLFKHVTGAPETTERYGSLLVTHRESDSLLVSYSAEVAASYEASFHVDTTGSVKADSVAWPM
jgi:hypothetical protein